jgi:hypothetical protein
VYIDLLFSLFFANFFLKTNKTNKASLTIKMPTTLGWEVTSHPKKTHLAIRTSFS